MHILWLKADGLLPLDKGGKLRTWHLMRQLARRHDIHFLSFVEPGTPREHIDGMREVATEVTTIERAEPRKRSLAFYAGVIRRLADRLPYAVGKYRAPAYRDAVARLFRDKRFDLVVCDFLPPMINLPATLPCPAVLFTHNVEAEIWRRHADTARGPVRSLYRAQWRRMQRFERMALARFDGILAVSDADRETFGHLYPGAARVPIDVVATGVDTTYFAPAAPTAAAAAAARPELVFTGSMDWLPNEDAMLHFCRDVFPQIRAAVPDVHLSIVGRAPTPPVQRLAGDGVTVTGRVDDVRPYLDRGAVFIVPLRIGGGTRLKIFEAMAMGQAVVSTTIGAEGLPVDNGRHLLLADTPEAFAGAVVQLLGDPARRQTIGDAARRLVVDHHDWAAVTRDLETALLRVASRAPGDAAAGQPSASSRKRATAVASHVAGSAIGRGL